MKFKIGDKVRIRKDLVADKRYGGIRFDDGMRKYLGKQFEIELVRKSVNGYALVDVTGFIGPYTWSGEMFETKPARPPKPKQVKYKYTVLYKEDGSDRLFAERFYSRKALMKWISEVQDDEAIRFDFVRVYPVEKEMKVTTSFGLRKV